MKKTLIGFLLIFVIFGCEKTEYKKTEFFLKNNCNYTIEVSSSALVRYSDGYKEESLKDIVTSGQLLSLRKLDVSDNFQIKNVFTKLEIYHGTIKSNKDVMNKSIWTKELTNGNDEFILNVDSTDFK